MIRYTYEAVDAANGRLRRGRCQAASEEAAIRALRAEGMLPTSLAVEGAQSGWTWSRRGPRLRRREVLEVTRRLATLVRAGVPLVRSLDLLARQDRKRPLHNVLVPLAENVRGGRQLSEALAAYPDSFDRAYCQLVAAGEASGTLAATLERLALLLERSERLNARVRGALAYPIAVLVVALLVLGALLVFVVPRFESVFETLLPGQGLPWLTENVIRLSQGVQHHALLLGGSLAAFALAWRMCSRGEYVKRVQAGLLLKTPLVGPLLQATALARLARTCGTLLAAGVPILQALALTAAATENRRVAAALGAVQRRVQAGEGLSRPIGACADFPPLVASLVEVGEETGTLPAMLLQVADIYDEEVERVIASRMALLEPALIVGLAVLVGTLVLALFLPLVQVIQALS